MPIDRDEVLATARLARLALSEPAGERLTRELGAILEHMDVLRALDTAGIEPMTHAVPTAMPLRPDVVEETLPNERALSGAPASDDGYFVVPKIIDRGDS